MFYLRSKLFCFFLLILAIKFCSNAPNEILLLMTRFFPGCLLRALGFHPFHVLRLNFVMAFFFLYFKRSLSLFFFLLLASFFCRIGGSGSDHGSGSGSPQHIGLRIRRSRISGW